MNQAALIRLWCGLGLSAGVALSPALWGLAPRTFPRVPVLGPPLAAPAEGVLTLVLMGAALGSAWRPRLRWLATAAALVLAWTDQQRWQPWAWEYLLVGALACGEPLPARLVLGAVVMWAGAWKFGAGYRENVAPWLGGGLPTALGWVVAAVPTFEVLTGAALWAGWPPARGAVRAAVLTMHGAALALLASRGWNSVVWPWQVASAAIAWVALGPGGDWNRRTRAGQSGDGLPPPAPATACRFSFLVAVNLGGAMAVALAVLLPAAWPLGVVNSYLAWRLYTGDPTDARLARWSISELNVPLSPAPWRVLRCPGADRQPLPQLPGLTRD